MYTSKMKSCVRHCWRYWWRRSSDTEISVLQCRLMSLGCKVQTGAEKPCQWPALVKMCSYVSQASVAMTCLRCDGIFNNETVTCSLLGINRKEFCKSVAICRRYWQDLVVTYFDTHYGQWCGLWSISQRIIVQCTNYTRSKKEHY